MSYSPINSDAPNVAGYVITRLNTTSPTTGAATNDQATAILDGCLGTLGTLAAPSPAACSGSTTTTSTSFLNIPNLSTFTFSIPVAKKYLVTVDGGGFWESAGFNGVQFQVMNNTTSTAFGDLSNNWFSPGTTARGRISFRVLVTMAAGSNVLQLQWRCFGGGGDTANVDTLTSFALTVTG